MERSGDDLEPVDHRFGGVDPVEAAYNHLYHHHDQSDTYTSTDFASPPVHETLAYRHETGNFRREPVRVAETPPAAQEPPRPRALAQPPQSVLVASAVCHALASLSLLIALAILASAPQTIDVAVGVELPYSSMYLSGTLIICIIYEFLQTIIMVIYIRMQIQVSQYITYTSDQGIATLLLIVIAAYAAYLKDLDDRGTCTVASMFCKQAIASTSFTFVALLFLIANIIISCLSFSRR